MSQRLEKWKKTLDSDKQKKAFDNLKPFMAELEAIHTKALVKIEKEIKEICQGVATTLLPYYIIFGKEIYSKQRKFKDLTLLNEVVILEQKWESRGLDPIILERIKRFYVQPYLYITPFRCDISLLDGPHILS